MIKKSFSTLAAFCLGIVISITIVACADDINDVVTGKCDCSEKWEELMDRLSNTDNEISELKSKFVDTEVATITHYMDGELDADIKWEYDNKGRISKCIVTYFDGGSDSYSFTYETGKCSIYNNGMIHWVIELKNPKSNNFEIVDVFIAQIMEGIC